MPRSKLNLVYIANDSSRRVTFTKRKDGLAKKADELTNLCGIEACVILSSPYDHEPEVWPSQLEAQKVIARFRKMSDLEQSELMLNQESFTQERLNKINEKLKKQEKVNQQQEMSQFMYDCLYGAKFDNLKIDDMNNLSGLISQKLRDIDRRLGFSQTGHHNC